MRGGILKLMVMYHALGVPTDHHSNAMERDMRLLLLCVLDDHQETMVRVRGFPVSMVDMVHLEVGSST